MAAPRKLKMTSVTFPLLLSLLVLPLISANSYTFRNPGNSFLEYHPEWTNGKQVALEFEFRTQQATAFLLHHTPLQVAEGGAKPQLRLSLWNGQFNVTHHLADYEETVTLSKGLNYDKWHKVSLRLDADAGELSVCVDDDINQTLPLRAFSEGSGARSYKEGRVISIVSVGGFNPEALQDGTHFIGCIREIHFLDETTGWFTPPIFADAEVELGCLDRCQTDIAPCGHEGLCINHYTQTSCDCFGTGHEGKHCDKQEQTTVTLQGSEWLSFVVYEDEYRSHSPTNRIAFDFKTGFSEGILFYGFEQYPQYNHLAVSLHNGTVHVSVVFVDQDSYDELYLAVGSQLSDNSWHHVMVQHEGHEVVVSLDGELDKMTTAHDQPHLHLPNVVYFGGMDVQANTLGLKTEGNFIGCLRSAYFNHHSVLEQLNTSRTVYHGGAAINGCQRVDSGCLQFTHSGSFVQVEHSEGPTMEVEIQFKTLKADGMLLYTEIRESNLATTGYFQVALSGGQIELSVTPSIYQQHMRKKSQTFSSNINDNRWHSLNINYQSGLVNIQFDDDVKVLAIQWLIEVTSSSFLGFGPDTHVKDGFIGCLRKVRLQSTRVNPQEVVHSQQSVGVTLGSCDLVDWCQAKNASQCLNAGRCISEWDQARCDCHRTKYEGAYCQFPQLRRTCEEYYQIGATGSGVWQVDLDGTGPLEATYVLCDMEVKRAGGKYGLTHVDNNLEEEAVVRAGELPDLKKVISYRGMTVEMLQSLVRQSESCQQYIQYNCYKAPLWLGRQTWLVSASGDQFDSMGSDTRGQCGCSDEHNCVDLRYSCNCDQRSGQWLNDSGLIRSPAHLPVTEMTFLQEGGKANVTLGPLQCVGTGGGHSAAKFSTEASYLQLPGWHGGDIQIRFRTSSPSALLLYQLSSDAYETDRRLEQQVQLLLALHDGNQLTLKMQRPMVDHTWDLPWRLNTGSWHLLTIEMSHGEMRVRIGDHRIIIDLGKEPEERPKSDKATHLYVAGSPSSAETGFPGLTGCIDGLVYNNEGHSLVLYMQDGSTDVLEGCQAGCDSNPCLNGAMCEEHWTSYTCHCANSLAHFGDQCQHNLNADMVHILEKSSYIQFDQSRTQRDLLNSDILFSFRTMQPSALLLYMHDELNNFIQLEMVDGAALSLRYNSWDSIHMVNMTVPALNDGTWQQVSLSLQPDIVHLVVNAHQATFPVDREKLTSFDQTPFHLGLPETVVPFRLFNPELAGYRLYVAGVPETFSHLEGLQGCISGLKIGDSQYNLAELADSRDDLLAACPSGCMEKPCLNSGVCVEDKSFNGQYACDCLETGYSGQLCDREIGIILDGTSYLVQKVQKSEDSFEFGYFEKVDFKFATRSPGRGKSAMVFVRGKTGLSDHILIYMTNDGHIVAKVGIGRETVHLTMGHSYATGDVHHVTLTRDHSQITLQVDGLNSTASLINSAAMDPPAVVIVGAVRKENFRFEDVDMYNGNLYNLFVLSDQLATINVRPLDAYLGYSDQDADVLAVGQGIQAVGTVSGPVTLMRTQTGPQAAAYSQAGDGTLPPWEDGAARTVPLSEGSAEETGSESGLHGGVAILVCVAFLALLIGGIVVIAIRSRRKRGTFAPQKDGGKDEEEGLLYPAPTSTLEGVEAEEIPTAKLRQGPKSKRTPSAECFDEENEETPMLQSEALMGTSSPPPGQEAIELTSFEQATDDLPMMDDGDDMELTLSPTMRAALPAARRRPSPEDSASEDTETEELGVLEGQEADQMEWDPQMDGPSPALTPSEAGVLLATIPEDEVVDPGSPDSQRLAPRDVLTESQILQMIEDEEQEQMANRAAEELRGDEDGDVKADVDPQKQTSVGGTQPVVEEIRPVTAPPLSAEPQSSDAEQPHVANQPGQAEMVPTQSKTEAQPEPEPLAPEQTSTGPLVTELAPVWGEPDDESQGMTRPLLLATDEETSQAVTESHPEIKDVPECLGKPSQPRTDAAVPRQPLRTQHPKEPVDKPAEPPADLASQTFEPPGPQLDASSLPELVNERPQQPRAPPPQPQNNKNAQSEPVREMGDQPNEHQLQPVAEAVETATEQPYPPAEESDHDSESIEDNFHPAVGDLDVSDSPLEPVVLRQESEPRPCGIHPANRGSSIFSSDDSFQTALDSTKGPSLEDSLNLLTEEGTLSLPLPEMLEQDTGQDNEDDWNATLKASDHRRLADFADDPLESNSQGGSGPETENDGQTVTQTKKPSMENDVPNLVMRSGASVVDNAGSEPVVNGRSNEEAINSSSKTAAADCFDFELDEEDDTETETETALVPEGTLPIRPPQGLSPGIPLKKGRRGYKQANKS